MSSRNQIGEPVAARKSENKCNMVPVEHIFGAEILRLKNNYEGLSGRTPGKNRGEPAAGVGAPSSEVWNSSMGKPRWGGLPHGLWPFLGAKGFDATPSKTHTSRGPVTKGVAAIDTQAGIQI